ncbi:hypothetical protein [Brevibacillus sp. H7]|uniref:hypothetical protein n=1 Tax=Brevibacillus sp. H7 TaxID=3349138 RepID=UPI0038139591
MPFLLLMLLAAALTGCSKETQPANPAIYSDPAMYYQQSIVHPYGLEPNATPYGTPTNATTAGEYDRPLRIDAVSNYGPAGP